MPAILIVNPMSGARGHRDDAARSRLAIAARVLSAIGAAAEIVLTERARHAGEIAAAAVARGIDRVIVWGGDGTVNDAAGPLIGSRTALAIVPSGSGDGLARGLRLSRDPEAALRLALLGDAHPIDVGWMGNRHFLNIAGIGFDAEVGHAFNQRARRGARGYISTGLSMVWKYDAADYDISAEGFRVSGNQFMVSFANGPEYGNGIVLCETASFDDGWLDAVVVAGGSPLAQLWRARRLGFRRNAPASGIVRARLQNARVTGVRLMCHVDGETFQAAGAVDIRMQALSLMVVSGRVQSTGR